MHVPRPSESLASTQGTQYDVSTNVSLLLGYLTQFFRHHCDYIWQVFFCDLIIHWASEFLKNRCVSSFEVMLTIASLVLYYVYYHCCGKATVHCLCWLVSVERVYQAEYLRLFSVSLNEALFTSCGNCYISVDLWRGTRLWSRKGLFNIILISPVLQYLVKYKRLGATCIGDSYSLLLYL